MKGTKKFYKNLINEIKFHSERIKEIKEKKKTSMEPSLYDYETGYHAGAIDILKSVCYEIYPGCELNKDLRKQD